tara:strand:- start:234 stop:386 length:153 start_codon:yes stop_codon:yes gene_type:complete
MKKQKDTLSSSKSIPKLKKAWPNNKVGLKKGNLYKNYSRNLKMEFLLKIH